MSRNRLVIALLFLSFLLLSSASAQTTPPNPCDPAQQEIILQYVGDQVSILQNSGVTPIRGLSSDDNKTFLKLWARGYLTTLCQTTSTTANDSTIANLQSRLTAVETTLRTTPAGSIDLAPINIRLSGLEAAVSQLSSATNQLGGLTGSITALNNQIAFLATAVSGDQSTLRNLQSSLDSINSRVSHLSTGAATISKVTIAKEGSSSTAYRLRWQSDVPSSAYVVWGYNRGSYPYQTGVVLSGQNTLVLYVTGGATIYLKVVATQSISGVKSESEEFALATP